MADSQVLTISYGGMQVTGQLVGGQVQVSVPAAALADSDGKMKALDPALLQKIIEIILQLLPIIFGGLGGGA